jgi:hypothetical protein
MIPGAFIMASIWYWVLMVLHELLQIIVLIDHGIDLVLGSCGATWGV